MVIALATALTIGPGALAGLDLRRADEVRVGGQPYVRIEGRVNEFDFSLQAEASLAVSPDGRFAVAWESRRQNEGLPGSLVRSFAEDGRPLISEARVSEETRFAQTRPTVFFVAGERPRVVFETPFRDGSLGGLFVGESRLTERVVGHQMQACVIPAGDGSLAVWSSEVARGEARIFARFLDARGEPASRELAVSEAGGRDVLPVAAPLGSGYAVVWQRFGPDGKPDGLWARRLDARGRVLGDEVRVGGPAAIEPALARAGDRVILGFVEALGSGDFAVRAVRLSETLERVGSAIAVGGPRGSQNGLAVAGREDGSFALAWNVLRDGERDAYAQTFDRSGRPTGPAIRLHRQVEGDQYLAEASNKPRLAYGTEGSLTAVWSGDGGFGDRSAVHFTRLVPRALAPAGLDELEAATRDRLRALAEGRRGADRGEMKVVAESTLTHQPPTFDPRAAEDPWGLERPLGSAGGFLGISNTGWTPPDPHLAVGPAHIVGITNGAIAFFTKTGTKTFQQPIEGANGFWGSLGATGFVFDPECFWDPTSGRFFAMASEGRAPGNRSYVLIAISASSDPNGVWYKYRFETTGLAGDLFDSPNIGTDPNVVYVTGDGFGLGANYPVYTFEKAPMLAGLPPTVRRETTLATSTQSAGIPPWMPGGYPAFYLLEHQEATNSTGVSLIALRNPLGSITFDRFTVPVPTYTRPENPPQAGSSVRMTAFDARFWSVRFVNGDLWATHHVGSSRVLARWYQIRTNGWPTSGQNPALIQWGEIDPGAGIRTFFSSIVADENGNATVICARSSPNEFISMYRATRIATDPLGTMPIQEIVKASTGPYSQNRWGDYSAADVDPAQPGIFWGHHEWAESNSWRTWIQPSLALLPRPTEQFFVRTGVVVSGNLASLVELDGNELRLRRAPSASAQTPGAIVVEFETTSPDLTLSQVILKVTSRVDQPNYRQLVEIWRPASGSWQLVDARVATQTNQSLSLPVTGDLRDPATRVIRARLRIENVAPVAQPLVDLFLDQFSFDLR